MGGLDGLYLARIHPVGAPAPAGAARRRFAFGARGGTVIDRESRFRRPADSFPRSIELESEGLGLYGRSLHGLLLRRTGGDALLARLGV